MENDECKACDFRCKNCFSGTAHNCTECNNDNLIEKIDSSNCECKKGYYANLIQRKCLPCPNLLCETCNPEHENDMKCTSCLRSASVVSTKTSTLPIQYECKCAESAIFNSTYLCLFHEGCHPLCKNGCGEQSNQNKCIDCVDGLNIASMKYDNLFSTCYCSADTILLDNTKCGYNTDCSDRCSKCYSKQNTTSCFDCLTGIQPVFTLNGTVICECPQNTLYFNGSCQIPSNQTCHPLCGDKGCLIPKDNTKCASCKNGMTQIPNDDYFICECPKFSAFDANLGCISACSPLCEKCKDLKTCEQCRIDIEGIILSNGICTCETSKGYILQENNEELPKCVKKMTEAAAAAQTTGTVVSGIIISTAIIGPGGGAFWKFISLSQELTLICLINVKNIPSSFISVIQGSSFIKFKFLDFLIAYLPPEIRGQTDDNNLEGNFQYHPSLIGKIFIANVLSQFFVAVSSVLGYALCYLLSMKFSYFKSYRDSFVFNGIIRLTQSCYIDIILCGIVQLKFPNFDEEPFYKINYFAAIFAIIYEALYVFFAYKICMKPVKDLNKNMRKQKFGAFYDDCKIYQPLRMASIIHNIRVFIIIVVLVGASECPLAQSVCFFALSFAGFLWDFTMAPYAEKLVSLQVHLINITKVLSGAGFIWLSIPSISNGITDSIYKYETVLYITSVSGGMLISVIQQIAEIYNSARNYCKDKNKKEVYFDQSGSIQNTMNTFDNALPNNISS